MWSQSSSLSTVNLEKKIYYNSRDIEFFLGGYFFMARPVYVQAALAHKWLDSVQP